MQIDWGRLSLWQLRWGLQHLLSSQLVSQNNLPKNSCLKLSFECKILLPLTQRISATSPNVDLHLEQGRTPATCLISWNGCSTLQTVGNLFLCFLPSSFWRFYSGRQLCMWNWHIMTLFILCDYFPKGSPVSIYLFSLAKCFTLWTLRNRDSVVGMFVIYVTW